MTTLIKRDTITIARAARSVDEHGWVTTEVAKEDAVVHGTIQQSTPRSDATATDAGGQGPAQPFHQLLATAYLDDSVAVGDLLEYDGWWWRIETVHLVEDPRGAGYLDCYVCTLAQFQHGEGIDGSPLYRDTTVLPHHVTYDTGGTYNDADPYNVVTVK